MRKGLGGKMRSAHRAIGFAVILSGLACGTAPPAPPPPPPAASVAPVLPVTPDLSEVAEPNHLVGIFRVKNLEATLRAIYEWTGLRLNAKDLASELMDKTFAGTLAFDAPLDAAVALEERGADSFAPLVAFAVGVQSLEATRAAAKEIGTVAEISPGEYKVHLRHGKKKRDKTFCVLSAAVGATPGRLVCGERERDVEALRTYMTRTLPKRDLGPADLHCEFRVGPAVDVYGEIIQKALHMGAALLPRKLQIGEPAFDRAIDRLALGVSSELGAVASDLDSLTLDLSMAPDKASLATALLMKSQTSWTASTLASMAARSAAPPPMYWHLPASATAAMHGYLPEARRFEAIRHTLGELADGWLQHEGMSQADRAAIMALLDEKYAIDTPLVAAVGTFPEPPAKRPQKGAAVLPSDPVQSALVRSGWLLIGIGAPNPAADFLKTVSSAASRPKVQAFLQGKLATLSSKSDREQEHSIWATGATLKAAPVPKELPKGSLAFELAISYSGSLEGGARAVGAHKAKAPTTPMKVQVLVVAESAQTWIAVGADKAQLTKTVLTATEGGPEAETLSARQDLSPLRQTKLAEGGFFTIESILNSMLAPATWVDTDVARNAEGAHYLLSSTPNKGKTPVLFQGEVATGDGATVTLRVEVPKSLVEDIAILAAGSGLAPRRTP